MLLVKEKACSPFDCPGVFLHNFLYHWTKGLLKEVISRNFKKSFKKFQILDPERNFIDPEETEVGRKNPYNYHSRMHGNQLLIAITFILVRTSHNVADSDTRRNVADSGTRNVAEGFTNNTTIKVNLVPNVNTRVSEEVKFVEDPLYYNFS